jgi:hypothetical protein
LEDKSSLTRHYLTSAVGAQLPFLWTVTVALIAGCCAASVAFVVNGKPIEAGVVTASFAAGVTFVISWSWWARKLDSLTRPVMPIVASRIEVYLDNRHRILPATLSVTPQELHKLATRIMGGANLSGRAMAGIMSPERFYSFQSELVQAKLAEQRNPENHKDGVKLTPLGWDTMKAIAALPLPRAELDGEVEVYRLFTQATQPLEGRK